MRGFLLGSLALIVLETLVRRADAAGSVLTFGAGALERFVSPDVAAIPNFAARKTPAPASPASAPAPATNPTVATFTPPGVVPSAGLA